MNVVEGGEAFYPRACRPQPFERGAAAKGLPSPTQAWPSALPVARGPRPADITVVIPTRNERGNVEPLVAALREALRGHSWEAIFVDDDSPDGTAEVAKSLARTDPRIRAIRRVGRRGLAGAAIEGMLASAAPYVAVMDGDLQHDPAILPVMLDVLVKQSADLVVATRREGTGGFARGAMSPLRLAISEAATGLAGRLLGIGISDPMSGFFMVRRDVVEAVAPRLSSQGFKILLDVVASAGPALRIREVPFEFRARHSGESKLDSRVVFEYLGLLVAKLTHDRVSIRFLMFGMVGGSGIFVNLAALRALMAASVAFAPAQLAATVTAMISNYLLHNTLTYRDQRLRGWGAARGLVSFVAVCSVGLVANVGLASLIYGWDRMWLVAGLAGAMIGSVWNYVATSAVTWRGR